MTNSIYSQFPQNGRNPMQIVQQFKQFKNNYKGDAKAEVENLLRTGKMTQAQFNQLQSMAQAMQSLFQ